MVTNSYSVLNAFTGATDAALADHVLSITGAPPMDFRKIELYRAVGASAGVPGVYLITPPATATAGSTYSLSINQFVKSLGKNVSVVLTYVATSAVTNIVIADALKAQLRAFSSAGLTLTVDADGATTMTITAVAPNNRINITSIGTGTLTVATSTGPVARVGNGADLLATPVGDLYGTTNFISTNSYKAYEFTYGSVQEKSTAGENALQVSKHIVFANTGGANYAAFDTQLTTLVQAIATSTQPIEGVAIG